MYLTRIFLSLPLALAFFAFIFKFSSTLFIHILW